MTTYLIHDNGGRPFKAIVHESRVDIYHGTHGYGDDDGEYHYFKDAPAYSFDVVNVFVGESPLNKMTRFSGGHGPEFLGNSLLLQISEFAYVYVGSEIYSFKTKHRIATYTSPVGNNDVPYPYAVDIEGNHYLLLERVMIRKNGYDAVLHIDPYDFYYDCKIVNVGHRRGEEDAKVQKNMFRGITRFYVGEETLNLSYHSDAKHTFKRLISDDEEVSIIQNGERKTLTKKKFVKLMKQYGKMMGFRPIKLTEICGRQ